MTHKNIHKEERPKLRKQIINNMARNIKITKNVKQDKNLHKIESYISKGHKRIGNKMITQTKKTSEKKSDETKL
jgi:hypothetical protein